VRLTVAESGVSVGICLTFGRSDNLLLDALKSLVLLILTRQCQARRLVVRR
jgi:hypothetical protein